MKVIRKIKKVKIYFEEEIVPEVIEAEKKQEEPKPRSLKGKKKDMDTDPCPVCQFDLSYNDQASQRIALLDGAKVDGWMCPNCYSRFTLKDKLESLGDILEIGEA